MLLKAGPTKAPFLASRVILNNGGNVRESKNGLVFFITKRLVFFIFSS